MVDLVNEQDELVATGAIGFSKVQRRDGDPPKPPISLDRITEMFEGSSTLTHPLREEAGIRVLDPMVGSVEMSLTPVVRNPAGTLQGAMVALLAEAAAEEMASARFDMPAVVTDLDLRYLAQTGAGPVRTHCRLLGDGPGAPNPGRAFRRVEGSDDDARLRPHRCNWVRGPVTPDPVLG